MPIASRLALLALLAGCRTGGNDASSELHEASDARPPSLPAPGGAAPPWGGSDSTQWRAEAIIANAASAALNRGWAGDGVADVLVALPLRIFPSAFFPYGDGQSNANPSFEGWKVKRPPLVATLVRTTDGAVRVTFRFDAALEAAQHGYDHVDVRFKGAGGVEGHVTLDGHLEDGALVATWENPPASLGWSGTTGEGVALVRPAPGFDDVFPITFKIPVRDVPSLIASVRTQLGQNQSQEHRDFLARTLVADRGGLRLTDADKTALAAQTAVNGDITGRIDELMELHRIDNPGITTQQLDVLRGKYVALATDGKPSVLKKALFLADLAPIYNVGRAQLPYMPLNIHGDYPAGPLHITTGVGMGWTWVADQDTPFKIMYTCFERRQPSAESDVNRALPEAERDGFGRTVASGGGWHRIGDNQETILNSLEDGPLVVASGFGVPTEKRGLAPAAGAGYVYGLRDVAVVRWLRPAEAFITVRTGGRGDDVEGKNSSYHWYFFDQDREVCTEEWVHLADDPNTPDFLAP